MRKFVLFLILYFLIFAHAFPADFDTVSTHGFISHGYLKSSDYEIPIMDSDDGTFQFNEMGITFTASLSEKFQIGMQFSALDFGDIGNDEIKLDWAYGV